MPATQPTETATPFDQKLAAILAAAAQVFAEEGYDRASIRSVAERAGVSVAGLYYYVRSKEELLYLIQFHVFTDLVDRYEAASERLSDPEARLKLLVSNHLERFLANMAELVVCSREIDRLKGEFAARLDAKRHEYFSLARRVFADLAEGAGETVVEPRMAALAMFGTMNWIHTWYRPGSGPSATRMADDFVRLYLRGVLPSGGPRATPSP